MEDKKYEDLNSKQLFSSKQLKTSMELYRHLISEFDEDYADVNPEDLKMSGLLFLQAKKQVSKGKSLAASLITSDISRETLITFILNLMEQLKIDLQELLAVKFMNSLKHKEKEITAYRVEKPKDE